MILKVILKLIGWFVAGFVLFSVLDLIRGLEFTNVMISNALLSLTCLIPISFLDYLKYRAQKDAS